METEKPNNPHAFANSWNEGMTLRDYFAAKVISNVEISHISQGFETEIAVRAYILADAMLKQREL